MTIQIDKILHIVVGCLITILPLYFLSWWGISISVILSVGKEMYDMYKVTPHNKFNWKDIIASFIGIGLGILIYLII